MTSVQNLRPNQEITVLEVQDGLIVLFRRIPSLCHNAVILKNDIEFLAFFMTSPSIESNSEDLTFEQAIAQTQTLLEDMAANDLSESETEAAIANLVKTHNGARGFFVTYLTDPRSFVDRPSEAVIRGLKTSEEVPELLIKNVAMSAAMAVHHRRNQREEMAASSDRVRSRSVHLIQSLNLPILDKMVGQLLESAKTGGGEYRGFLERWGYDGEQREAIVQAIHPLI